MQAQPADKYPPAMTMEEQRAKRAARDAEYGVTPEQRAKMDVEKAVAVADYMKRITALLTKK